MKKFITRAMTIFLNQDTFVIKRYGMHLSIIRFKRDLLVIMRSIGHGPRVGRSSFEKIYGMLPLVERTCFQR